MGMLLGGKTSICWQTPAHGAAVGEEGVWGNAHHFPLPHIPFKHICALTKYGKGSKARMMPRCAGRQHPSQFFPAPGVCWLRAPQHRDRLQEQSPQCHFPITQARGRFLPCSHRAVSWQPSASTATAPLRQPTPGVHGRRSRRCPLRSPTSSAPGSISSVGSRAPRRPHVHGVVCHLRGHPCQGAARSPASRSGCRCRLRALSIHRTHWMR